MGSFSQLKSFPVKWDPTDRHTMGSFYQFKLSPVKWNQTNNVFMGMLSTSIQPVHSRHEFIFQRNSKMLLFGRNNEILFFVPNFFFLDLLVISFFG